MSDSFKRKRHSAWVRTEAQCPECYTDRMLKWRKGVKRFKAQKFSCGYCEFVGRLGEWDTDLPTDQ